MPLVDYSSSDDEEVSKTNEKQEALTKLSDVKTEESIAILPPLPSSLRDLYNSNVRTSNKDDPTLHDGRKRQTPHIDGDWPTHIYIEWNPSCEESLVLENIIDIIRRDFNGAIESHLQTRLGVPLPLHISLSRPIAFATDIKDGFLVALQRSIAASSVQSYTVHFSDLKWVSNYSKSRWFLVLGIKRPASNELNKMLSLCNHTVEHFGQPPLYADSSIATLAKGAQSSDKSESISQPLDRTDAFHVSIAWTLCKPMSDEEATILDGSDDFVRVKNMQINVVELKAKIGNVITSIPLQSTTTSLNGIYS